MSRWQPDAPLRLQAAALELFAEKGYEATTIEEIAQRAQLTRRTFFRYFADKREALFFGSSAFETAVLESLRNERAADPLERIVDALAAVAVDYFDARAAAVRRRRRIIQSSPELQERESKKMSHITDQSAALLAAQAVDAQTARFAAELGVLVFRQAFELWADAEAGTLADAIRQTFARLRAIVVGAPAEAG